MKNLNHINFFGKTYRFLIHSVFLIVFLLCSNYLNAQGPEWLTTIGGGGSDYVNAVQKDDNGNIYACGYFSGTVDFNPD
ncbi:MAG: hypothetical protein R6U65_07160, partial [Perlabentimonas sp.]